VSASRATGTIDRPPEARLAVTRRPETRAGEQPYHAVHDLSTLASMLRRHLRAGRSLDAFLCAAGMWQVLEDHVRRDVGDLTRVAKYAGRLPGPAGPAAGAALRGVVTGSRRLRWRTSDAAALRLAAELASLVSELAELVVAGREWERDGGDLQPPVEDRVPARVARLPAALRRTIAIPPRSFFSFDQRPEDCERLAADFAERRPDREVPLAVVGVRTSGSYLAPLVAACLRRLGYRHVDVRTWRPGQPVLRSERRALRALAAAGGLALVVDDPPTSGGSLARVAGDLEREGVPAGSVVFLLQLFDSPGWWGWPRRLEGRELVLLPLRRWAVWDRLGEAAVAEALGELLAGRTVLVAGERELGPAVRVAAVRGAHRVPGPGIADLRACPSGREHVRAVFRVDLADDHGRVLAHHVLVRGAGLGHFGDQALAAADRLRGLVPETYGVRDGMLYRAWLPEALRADAAVAPERLAAAGAAYVAARRSGLTVPEDVSARMEGHHALWERCSLWAGGAYGRLALLLRPALHRASRRLLATPAASLIDGEMGPADWFEAGGELVRTGFEERAFRYQVPFCYDPAYDLAAAAGARPDPPLGELLRREYRRLTGEEVSEERWFLHGLLHLAERRDLHVSTHAAYLRDLRRKDGSSDAVAPSRYALVGALTEGERAMSRAHERYFGDVFLGDLEPPARGPICAVDIDGVLETGGLSYPAITPAGALALRALARHGYRAVLATGRSLDEVRERCAAYRLAGGVAEYGAVMHDHRSGRTEVLLDTGQRADLDRVRAELMRLPGVVVEPRYRHGVRAWRLDGVRRRCLEPGQVELALRRAGVEDRVRPIAGWAQTDFMAAGVDKGTGLRRLTEALGEPTEGRFLALAVGDSVPDVAMFAHARLAAAPANADPWARALTADLAVMRRPYQAGLLQAVERLLGHRQARCRTCAPPDLRGDRRLLVAMLAAQDRGRPGKLLQGVRLALEANRR